MTTISVNVKWKRILESKTWNTEEGTNRETLKRKVREHVSVYLFSQGDKGRDGWTKRITG